jgi:hypothetical protein
MTHIKRSAKPRLYTTALLFCTAFFAGVGGADANADTGSDSDESMSVSVSVSFDTEEWMGQLYENNPDVPFNEVFIPGTHRSASSGVSKKRPRESEDTVPDSWFSYFGDDAASVLAPWLKTQTKGIKTQLEDGIRYLDFNLTWRDDKKALWTGNGLVSKSLSRMLRHVSLFADAHPTEIVVVDFSRVPADHYTDLQSLLKRWLHDDAIDGGAYTASSSVGDLWDSGRNVVILVPDSSLADMSKYYWLRDDALNAASSSGSKYSIVEIDLLAWLVVSAWYPDGRMMRSEFVLEPEWDDILLGRLAEDPKANFLEFLTQKATYYYWSDVATDEFLAGGFPNSLMEFVNEAAATYGYDSYSEAVDGFVTAISDYTNYETAPLNIVSVVRYDKTNLVSTALEHGALNAYPDHRALMEADDGGESHFAIASGDHQTATVTLTGPAAEVSVTVDNNAAIPGTGSNTMTVNVAGVVASADSNSSDNAFTVTVGASGTPAIHSAADWMVSVVPLDDCYDGITLGDLFIPGAHLAGTSGITPASPVDSQDDDAVAAAAEFGAESLAHWSRTHVRTVAELLEQGVRHVHLNVTPVADADGDGITFWVSNGLLSRPLADVLEEVHSFAYAHRNEMVWLEIGGDLSGTMQHAYTDHFEALNSVLSAQLGGDLLGTAQGAPPTPGNMSLNDARATGRNVLAFVDEDFNEYVYLGLTEEYAAMRGSYFSNAALTVNAVESTGLRTVMGGIAGNLGTDSGATRINRLVPWITPYVMRTSTAGDLTEFMAASFGGILYPPYTAGTGALAVMMQQMRSPGILSVYRAQTAGVVAAMIIANALRLRGVTTEGMPEDGVPGGDAVDDADCEEVGGGGSGGGGGGGGGGDGEL